MGRRGSYIGGHTLLVQRPGDFEAELERKSVSARKKAEREQAAYDKARARKLANKVAKLDALNRAAEKAAAERRARGEKRTTARTRHEPKKDFVVFRVSRKVTRSAASVRPRVGDD
jgi:hypothetical protein